MTSEVDLGLSDELDEAFCVADFERIAVTRLPADLWDFVAGGSGAELTVAANRLALDRVAVAPKVLTGAAAPSLTAALFGATAPMPVAVAPMAYQRLLHPAGELAVARAAADVGIPFVTSTLSSHPLEEIAAIGATTWMQLYWLRDRAAVLDLIHRAEAAGSQALVLTVDVPVMGNRLRDRRNGFVLPPNVIAANLEDRPVSGAHRGRDSDSAVIAFTREAFDPTLSWANLQWLRENSALPLVLKGVLDPDDAARAADLGVSGIIVSNHGGRQLDGAVPSIQALPRVCEAVEGRCPVLFDSGIRGGTDALRALALGASWVLLGRPVLWALAAAGQPGVRRVLELFRTELAEAMCLAGCPDLAAISRLGTTILPTTGKERHDPHATDRP